MTFSIFHLSHSLIQLFLRLKDLTAYNMERTITILGTIDNCKKAESLISAKLRASYESDMTQFMQYTSSVSTNVVSSELILEFKLPYLKDLRKMYFFLLSCSISTISFVSNT